MYFQFQSPCGELVGCDVKSGSTKSQVNCVSLPLRGISWLRPGCKARVHNPAGVSIPLRGISWLRRPIRAWRLWIWMFQSPCGELVGCDATLNMANGQQIVSIPLRGISWLRLPLAELPGDAERVSIPLRGISWLRHANRHQHRLRWLCFNPLAGN